MNRKSRYKLSDLLRIGYLFIESERIKSFALSGKLKLDDFQRLDNLLLELRSLVNKYL